VQQPALADFDAVFRARYLASGSGASAGEQPPDPDETASAPEIEGDASLADVVIAVAEHGRVAVIGGWGHLDRGRLDTLVFRSWLFGILTFLEARARERIRRDPDWRSAISPGRLEKARALKDERNRRGRAMATVDALQFGDLGWLATRYEGWYALFGVDSRRQAKRLVRQLEALRNALAHGQDVVTSEWETVVSVATSVKIITTAEREVSPPRR
jgi:hypothetical protein